MRGREMIFRSRHARSRIVGPVRAAGPVSAVRRRHLAKPSGETCQAESTGAPIVGHGRARDARSRSWTKRRERSLGSTPGGRRGARRSPSEDRANGNAPRCATLEAEAFLRRFLLHVLPDRFVRIRHYSWLANSAGNRLLPTVREFLLGPSAAMALSPPPVELETWEATLLRLTGKDVTRCPHCGAGGFLIVEAVPATAEPGTLSLRVRSP